MVDGVAHVEIDAESHLDLVRRLDIMRTPTVLILDAGGRIVQRASGAPRKVDVLAALGAPSASAPAAMIMHKVATKSPGGTNFAHDRRELWAEMTGSGRRPYHRGVNQVKVDEASVALVLVKRRAVDLCRVAACLCPMP